MIEMRKKKNLGISETDKLEETAGLFQKDLRYVERFIFVDVVYDLIQEHIIIS